MDIGYVYMIPIIFAGVYLVLQLLTTQTQRNEERFTDKRSNLLYNWSFLIPFRFFIQEDKRDKKAREMDELIEKAGLSERIDYRSLTVLQFLLFFGGFVLFGVLSIAVKPMIFIVQSMFHLNLSSLYTDPTNKSIIMIILLFLSLAPSILIKSKIKKRTKSSEIDFLKDLPLLQLFIILMLRSNKTINDVFYVLSTTETTYKETFEKAYRIYLREPSKGFDYLEDVFNGTKMIETIYTLRDYPEYARNESIRALENNQEQILEFSQLARKKAEAGRNIFATVSMSFPFIAVMLLAAGPVAAWAVKLLTTSGIV